jgi:transcriptional regulator with XRE-family HTH domain
LGRASAQYFTIALRKAAESLRDNWSFCNLSFHGQNHSRARAMKSAAKSGKRRSHLSHVDKQVGAQVKFFRMHRGLSQGELGATLGITFQQIQKYEKGTNAIATARLPSLCKALGITPNDLYGDLFNGMQKGPPAAVLPQMTTASVKAGLLLDDLPATVRGSVVRFIRTLAGGPEE